MDQSGHLAEPLGTAYLPLKRELLRTGYFSCSQQGFNIALPPLVNLYRRLSEQIGAIDPAALPWLTPPLIREDWVPRGVWKHPAEELWCTEQPGGHLLTPRPAMHLLNRLRHHPVDNGAWLVSGAATRDEQFTLPLYSQRTFTQLEYVWLGAGEDVGQRLRQAWQRLQEAVAGWNPRVRNVYDPSAGIESLELGFADLPPVPIARNFSYGPELLGAYGLERYRVVSIALSMERCGLAWLAYHGPTEAG